MEARIDADKLTEQEEPRTAVAKLVDSNEVELIDYSKRLVGILDERSAQFEGSLASLRVIAEKTQDRDFFSTIEQAEKRFDELQRSEEAARRQADEERLAKEDAVARAVRAETVAKLVSTQLDEEKKRKASAFLVDICI